MVAFDKRVQGNPDSPADYGNTQTEWAEQFRCRAAFIHLWGGEQVLAGRLQGQHLQVMLVRSSSETRQIATDWRARDVNSGIEYNVRDITPHEDDNQWLDVLCQAGVAI